MVSQLSPLKILYLQPSPPVSVERTTYSYNNPENRYFVKNKNVKNLFVYNVFIHRTSRLSLLLFSDFLFGRVVRLRTEHLEDLEVQDDTHFYFLYTTRRKSHQLGSVSRTKLETDETRQQVAQERFLLVKTVKNLPFFSHWRSSGRAPRYCKPRGL